MDKELHDGTVTIRIGKSERAMLDALAARDGLSISGWLRMTIRRNHIEVFGVEATTRTKKVPRSSKQRA